MHNKDKGMESVMNTLNESEAPDFYLVAGDNYYPEKREVKGAKKKKIFNLKQFEQGFSYLRRLARKNPVYLLMGNHDLDLEDKLEYKTGEKIKNGCIIINEQMKYTEFNSTDYSISRGDTLILLMNSHYYSKKYDPAQKDCNSYYRDGIQVNEEAILENRLINRLNKGKQKLKNLVVVAHLPIVTLRDKEKKDIKKVVTTPLNQSGLSFLHRLYSHLDTDVNKYYLCADTHQYQEASIRLDDILIKQYVVGTGGTKCDECCLPTGSQSVESPSALSITYNLDDCNRSYGFLKCYRDSEGDLYFAYQNVKDCSGYCPARSVKQHSSTEYTVPSVVDLSKYSRSRQSPSLSTTAGNTQKRSRSVKYRRRTNKRRNHRRSKKRVHPRRKGSAT